MSQAASDAITRGLDRPIARRSSGATGLRRAYAFNLILAVAVALHLMFDGTYLLQGLAYSNVIKLAFFGLLTILALRDGGPLGRPAALIMFVYALVSLQAIVVAPISGEPAASIYGAAKFAYRSFLTFWALSKCFESRLVNLSFVTGAWVVMAAYFSAAGILMFVLIQVLGYELPTVTLNLTRIGEVREIVIGLGDGSSLPKLYSFFSESNKFAQFLLPPFFVLLVTRATLWSRLFLAVVAIAFALTFSAASTAGLLLGLVLWVALRVRRRALRWLIIGGGALALALGALYIYQTFWAPYQYNPTEDQYYYVLLVRKAASVQDTTAQLSYGVQLASSNPLGIGMADREATAVYGFGDPDAGTNTASGIAQVLGRSGWPGLVLYAVMGIVTWRVLVTYAAKVRAGSADPKGLGLGIGYFALFVAATNYGPYDQRTLIVCLALFLAFANRYVAAKGKG